MEWGALPGVPRVAELGTRTQKVVLMLRAGAYLIKYLMKLVEHDYLFGRGGNKYRDRIGKRSIHVSETSPSEQ